MFHGMPLTWMPCGNLTARWVFQAWSLVLTRSVVQESPGHPHARPSPKICPEGRQRGRVAPI